MRKYSFLLLLLLSSTALLLYCSGPTEPELDNPYDQESGSYVPTPDLNTAPVTPLAQAAITGGEFTNDYGKPVTRKGVCWSTSENPDIEDSCTNDGEGIGSFESQIEGLEVETTYYTRAYAKNADGTIYGGQRSFTTQPSEPDMYTLDLSVSPSNAGGVSGAGEYEAGATVMIAAVEHLGYEFINWTGDVSHVENANSIGTSVTMPASNISLTANFQQEDVVGFSYCGLYGNWDNDNNYCVGEIGHEYRVTLEEASTSTSCNGYYKTYGYFTEDDKLVALLISNGHCRASNQDFYVWPPESLSEHCLKHGGTGNYKWRYHTNPQYQGNTIGVQCEVFIDH